MGFVLIHNLNFHFERSGLLHFILGHVLIIRQVFFERKLASVLGCLFAKHRDKLVIVNKKLTRRTRRSYYERPIFLSLVNLTGRHFRHPLLHRRLKEFNMENIQSCSPHKAT